jgi:hypothetical protein
LLKNIGDAPPAWKTSGFFCDYAAIRSPNPTGHSSFKTVHSACFLRKQQVPDFSAQLPLGFAYLRNLLKCKHCSAITESACIPADSEIVKPESGIAAFFQKL